MKKYLFRSITSIRPTGLLPFVLLFTIGMMGISTVAAHDPTTTPVSNAGASNPTLMAALNRSGAQISFRPDTGKANFIGAANGIAIKQPIALAQGSLFGITNQSRELTRMTEKQPDRLRKFERFQQVYNGVLVVGDELCLAGSIVEHPIFSDDLESGDGNWSFQKLRGPANGWQLDSPYLDIPHSGLHYLYGDGSPVGISDDTATLTTTLHIPPNAYLHFSHFDLFYYTGTTTPDGGVVEYSNNGGGTWYETRDLFDANGYNGTITSGVGNVLGGSPAFVGESHDYVSSRINLSNLVGQDVMFRWRMSLTEPPPNSGSGYYGWYLDDVQLYTCISVSVAPPRNYFTIASPALTWNPVTNATQYIVQVSKLLNFATLSFPAVTVPISQLSITTPALSEGIYYWRVSANNGVTWSVPDSFTIDLP